MRRAHHSSSKTWSLTTLCQAVAQSKDEYQTVTDRANPHLSSLHETKRRISQAHRAGKISARYFGPLALGNETSGARPEDMLRFTVTSQITTLSTALPKDRPQRLRRYVPYRQSGRLRRTQERAKEKTAVRNGCGPSSVVNHLPPGTGDGDGG
ncbi:hypothetical protein HYQ46_005759 [Verticillium longisporum]|nr:hypothetical protein HYQ46_005759 [Verticillium longisporum]